MANSSELAELDGDKRYFGEFRCQKCQRGWESANAWRDFGQQCTFCRADIIPMKLLELFWYYCMECRTTKKYKWVDGGQKCRNCGSNALPKTYGEHKELIDRLDLDLDSDSEANHIDQAKPHLAELCQKCKYLGRSCTGRVNAPTDQLTRSFNNVRISRQNTATAAPVRRNPSSASNHNFQPDLRPVPRDYSYSYSAPRPSSQQQQPELLPISFFNRNNNVNGMRVSRQTSAPESSIPSLMSLNTSTVRERGQVPRSSNTAAGIPPNAVRRNPIPNASVGKLFRPQNTGTPAAAAASAEPPAKPKPKRKRKPKEKPPPLGMYASTIPINK